MHVSTGPEGRQICAKKLANVILAAII